MGNVGVEGDDSLKELKERYANGKISRKRYLEIKAELSDNQDGTASKEPPAGSKLTKRTDSTAPTSAPKNKQSPAVAVAVIVIFLVIIFLVVSVLNPGSPCNGTGCASTSYTTSIAPVYTVSLFAAGQSFTIGPASKYYGEYLGFTIPPNATNINITGAYASTGSVEVALLSIPQHAAFETNKNSMSTNNTYYYGNANAASLFRNLTLAPGTYYLQFYDSESSGAANVTITSPVSVHYAVSSARAKTLAAVPPDTCSGNRTDCIVTVSLSPGGADTAWQVCIYSSSDLIQHCNANKQYTFTVLEPYGSTLKYVCTAPNFNSGGGGFSWYTYTGTYSSSSACSSSVGIPITGNLNITANYRSGGTTVTTTVGRTITIIKCGGNEYLGSDGNCYPESTTTVQSCDTGYYLGANGNCYFGGCGPGEYFGSDNSCHPVSTTTVESCGSEEYLGADGSCYPVITSTIQSCGPGEYLGSDGSCYPESTTMLYCSSGQYMGSDGNCYSTSTIWCSSGYFDGVACQLNPSTTTIASTTSIPNCGDGYWDGQECVPYTSVTTVSSDVCPYGYWNGDYCCVPAGYYTVCCTGGGSCYTTGGMP